MEGLDRILVVSRLTTNCRKAVHYGVSLVRKCGAELSVLHVIDNPFVLRLPARTNTKWSWGGSMPSWIGTPLNVALRLLRREE
jgi:nucleotide-binding universal stress UspA family protein